jgi:hypothetical protein
MVREWFLENDITLACGDWSSGAIMELVPAENARLTKARYQHPFSGLRDVRLPGQGHHIHLDLDKIRHVIYAVVPSVCYGYRPSFEAQFTSGLDRAPSFAVMVRNPYPRGRVDRSALARYFRRMREHLARYPEIVHLRIEEPPMAREPETWAAVRAYLAEAAHA